MYCFNYSPPLKEAKPRNISVTQKEAAAHIRKSHSVQQPFVAPHQLQISVMLVLRATKKVNVPPSIHGASASCARSFLKCWDISSDPTLADLSDEELKGFKQDNSKTDEERWWYGRGFAQGIHWLRLDDEQKAVDDASRIEDIMTELDRSCLEQRRPFMESTSLHRGLVDALQVDGVALGAKQQDYGHEIRPDEDSRALDKFRPPWKRRGAPIL